MKDIKIYMSDACCGYNQFAYVIPIKKSENGWDFLCLEVNGDDDFYVVGEIVKDLEPIYICKSLKKIDDFDISKTFLMKHFIETFEFLDIDNEVKSY